MKLSGQVDVNKGCSSVGIPQVDEDSSLPALPSALLPVQACPSTVTPCGALHPLMGVLALDPKPGRAGGASGHVKDLVETALGAVLVACLVLAALVLPCALIDLVAGTNLLGPIAAALLLAFSAAAILGVVAIQQRRSSGDNPGRRSLGKKGEADRDDGNEGRRR